MSDNSDLKALPPAVQRVIPAFRRFGWISFWVQVVLAVVAGLIFLFAILVDSPQATQGASTRNVGTGPGTFFAVLGLITLGISIYWAFRYTRLATQLESSNPKLRPKKADAFQLLQRGLIVNLVGMLFSLMGAEAIGGTLLAKAVQYQAGTLPTTAVNLNQFIQPLDIFVVLANTHTIVAHFAGIVTALWLLNWIYKKTQE